MKINQQFSEHRKLLSSVFCGAGVTAPSLPSGQTWSFLKLPNQSAIVALFCDSQLRPIKSQSINF